VAHAHFPTRPLGGRVYRAILSQALPYMVYCGLAGATVGVLLGIVASIASLDSMYTPIILLYTVAGLVIGTAVGIRPVFRELLAFHWSADVHGR
jgi:hypothetical protein